MVPNKVPDERRIEGGVLRVDDRGRGIGESRRCDDRCA
ncbi:MAG: hypothetical protein QOI13_3683 [Paraburkholderia sp.]|jgi:hypothetical protein|nr:hypothetical protein [Paraburkholderia sp.]